jgi:hypothetical protein
MKSTETNKERPHFTPFLYRINNQVQSSNQNSIVLEKLSYIIKEMLFCFNENNNIDKFHILIYGEAGVGKTETLRFIKKSLNTYKKFTHIFDIDFNLLNNPDWHREYPEELKSNLLACFIHYCGHRFNNKSLRSEVTYIGKLFYDNAIIIVDGYSYLFVEHNKMLEEVFKLKNVIISSKYFSKKLKEHKFDLSLKHGGFGPVEVRHFIEYNLGKSSKLIDLVFKYPELKKIIENPYHLKIICTLWQQYQDSINYYNYKPTITTFYQDLVYSIIGQYIIETQRGFDQYNLDSSIIKNHPLTKILAAKAANSFFGLSMIIDEQAVLRTLTVDNNIMSMARVFDQIGLIGYKTDSKTLNF